MNNQALFQQGSLLLELLIVIAVLAIVFAVGSQAIYVSLQGNKISGDRDVAAGLASESLEAVRGAAEADWTSIYSLTKTSQHYQTVQSANTWTLTTGDETVTLNSIPYTRYVIIENVCRDDTTRAITGVGACAGGSADDPSTQKVTVTVSWTNADPVTVSEYFFRWKNQVCSQTDWSGAAGTGDTVKTCATDTYDTKDPEIDVSTGAIMVQ